MSAVAAALSGVAIGGLGVGAGLLLRGTKAPEPRTPLCGDCKTPNCTGALHEIGAHDPEVTR